MASTVSSGVALQYLNGLKSLRRYFALQAAAFIALLALLIIETTFIIAVAFSLLNLKGAISPIWFLGFTAAIAQSFYIASYYAYRARTYDSFIGFFFRRSAAHKDAALTAFNFAERIVVRRDLDINTEAGELALNHINGVLNSEYNPEYLPSAKNLARMLRAFAVLFLIPSISYVFFPNKLYPVFSSAAQPVIKLLISEARADEKAVLSDISITYTPPAYTGLNPHTISGSDGNITALRGSRIEIEARLPADVKSAEVFLPGGLIAPAEVSGGLFKTAFEVMEGGGYRCEFKKTLGSLRGKSRLISIIPDEPPRVQMFGPEGFPPEASELIANGSEKLMLSYRAEDDFGLLNVKLVYGRPGEKKVEKEVASNIISKRYSNSVIWDISEIGGAPGERIAFYFAASDNDALNGPKEGASQVKYLKIFSLSEHEREQEKEARAIWESAVSSLAAYLSFGFLPEDGPTMVKELIPLEESSDSLRAQIIRFLERKPLERISKEAQGAEGVTEKIRAAFARFEEDIRGDKFYLQSSFGTARLIYATGGAKGIKERISPAMDRHIGNLEKHILYIEDLLDRLRIDNIYKRMEELAKRYESLKTRLDELMKSGEAKLQEELLAEINRLMREMQELSAQLAELNKTHNDEFVNMKAMMEKREADWQELARLIKEGELEQAKKRLSEIGEMMDDIRKQLAGKMTSIDSQYQEFMRDFMVAYNDLEKAEREQERLVAETKALDEQLKNADNPRVKKEMDDLIAQIDALAQKISDDIQKISPKTMEEIRPAFYQGFSKDMFTRLSNNLLELVKLRDFFGANEAASALHTRLETAYWHLYRFGKRDIPAKMVGEVNNPRKDAADIKRLIEKLLETPRRNIGAEEKKKFEELAERQKKLKRHTDSLAEKFEKLRKEAPVLGEELPQGIREGAMRMAEAERSLGENASSKALSSEQQALGKLRGAKEALKRMAQGAGESGGFPIPIAQGRGAGGDGRQGMGGFDSREDVKIPAPEEFKAPHEYRDELMRGMKLPVPKEYKPQVKRYFEELAR